MKKSIYFLLIAAAVIVTLVYSKPVVSGDYVVIAWNDMGMPFSSKDFSTLAILPPGNNIYAQVIKRGANGNYPQIVTSGIRVTYEIQGNTYSVGKTNFWTYASKLFSNIQANKGLKGAGMSGDMAVTGNSFKVEGVPITPYTDANTSTPDPFQTAIIKVYDLNGTLLASTSTVAPVSNEISCVSSGCHGSEQSILNGHESEGGFNPNNKPVMCAKCHGSYAIGTTSGGETGTFSYRIHSRHQNITSDCIKCHPGPTTKMYRGSMLNMGYKCTDCHGTMAQIASTSRRPWQDEPSCSKTGCHASQFAPNANTLYKDSKGHSSIYCSACHGTSHAEYTSTNDKDNQQLIDLQGHVGKAVECWVCHGTNPSTAGPHGVIVSVKDNKVDNDVKVYPNPASDFLYLSNIKANESIEFYSLRGARVSMSSPKLSDDAGEAKYDIRDLPNGTYIIRIGQKTVQFVKM